MGGARGKDLFGLHFTVTVTIEESQGKNLKQETYPLAPKLDHVMEEKWGNDEGEHGEEQRNDEKSNDNRKGHKMSM